MMPDFVQAVQDLCRSEMLNIHTAMPATITAYNQGRVDVKISGKFYIGGQAMDYPVITGCPVVTVGNGLAVPINVGDFCLLIFTEQSLSEWTSGTASHTNEKWSLTNAVALCGLTKVESPLQAQANAGGGTAASTLTSNGAIVQEGMNLKQGVDSNSGRIDTLEDAVGEIEDAIGDWDGGGGSGGGESMTDAIKDLEEAVAAMGSLYPASVDIASMTV